LRASYTLDARWGGYTVPGRQIALVLALTLMLVNASAGGTFEFRARVDVIAAGTVTDSTGENLAPGGCTPIATSASPVKGSGSTQIERTSEADPATTEQRDDLLSSCVISVVYE
jgi:hypothetical protein